MRDLSDIQLVTPNGIRVMLTLSADSPVFSTFFEAYDKAFVLPDEKEERAGLAAALALNEAPRYGDLAQQYGPYAEVCLVAFDGDTPIGGLDMFAMTTAGGAEGIGITANLNYIFVPQASRGRGYMRELLDVATRTLQEISPLLGAPGGSALVFVEQNDPFRLSAEQYRIDTETSGIDQFERLYVWARLGARFIQFPYVQPPLSAAQKADDTLVYAVLDEARTVLDAALLRHHLERFFAISVLKGAPLSGDAAAMSQLARLDRMSKRNETVGVCDLRAWLEERLRQANHEARLPDSRDVSQRPASLLEAAGYGAGFSQPR